MELPTTTPRWLENTIIGKSSKTFLKKPKTSTRLEKIYKKYGFCLIEDGLSEYQCEFMKNRLEEQAQAERECGLADLTPHFHIMWTLINKGDCFAKCIEFDRVGPVRTPHRTIKP